jgi:hypothetical protein
MSVKGNSKAWAQIVSSSSSFLDCRVGGKGQACIIGPYSSVHDESEEAV